MAPLISRMTFCGSFGERLPPPNQLLCPASMSSPLEGASRIENCVFKDTACLPPGSVRALGGRVLWTSTELCTGQRYQPCLLFFREAEESSKIRVPATMKKFEDSEKAKKPVRSMIETRGEKPKEKAKNNKKKGTKKEGELAPDPWRWSVLWSRLATSVTMLPFLRSYGPHLFS